jgi:long-chain acyl-CoA synthetase
MAFEPHYKTLAQIFRESVDRYGPRELFGTKRAGRWQWTTYAELGTISERCRGGLKSLGVGPGDRVGIISNNRVEWAVAAYACFGLGAAFVPMYEAQNPKEWEFILRDCGAKVLIVANDSIADKVKAFLNADIELRHVVVIETTSPPVAPDGPRSVTTFAFLLDAGKPVAALNPAPEDMAVLIYTSGTTGTPKGVMLTHLNIASNVSAIHEIFRFSPEERSLAFLPWAHVFGQTAELYLLISFGASMALAEAPDKIVDNLAEVRPTLLFSVPRVFNRLYIAVKQQLADKPRIVQLLVDAAVTIGAKQRAGSRLALHERAIRAVADKLVFEKVRARFGGRLTFTVSGSAALSSEVAEFIDSVGILVYEGYGLTETSPVVSVNFPGARKMGTVGRTLPGVRVVIDTAAVDGGQAVSRDSAQEGEIIVYGPNVMKGYYKKPHEEAAILTADGGLRTGDMGRVDSDGYLMLTGRIKEQYKLENGRYVVPSALEEQLKLSPYVLNVMVYGDNKPHNVAVVVVNVTAVTKWAEHGHISVPSQPDALLSDERVRGLIRREIDRCSAQFRPFETIADFVLIADDFTTDNGMLTPKMSIKRRRVIEHYAKVIEELYARPKETLRRAAGVGASAS